MHIRLSGLFIHIPGHARFLEPLIEDSPDRFEPCALQDFSSQPSRGMYRLSVFGLYTNWSRNYNLAAYLIPLEVSHCQSEAWKNTLRIMRELLGCHSPSTLSTRQSHVVTDKICSETCLHDRHECWQWSSYVESIFFSDDRPEDTEDFVLDYIYSHLKDEALDGSPPL